jgi:hypothetical protein
VVSRVDGARHRGLDELDPLLLGLCRRARLLPALVAENAASERARILAGLSRGEPSEPRWDFRREAPLRAVFSALERARRLAESVPGPLGAAYLARLDEVELDLWILEALADPHGARRARALGARRFGTAQQPVDGTPLLQVARRWLDALPAGEEERTVGAGEVAEALAATARAAGLAMAVKIEPRLAAGAATGEHTIFVADRRFGARERVRLCAHEVLGHAVVGHNARSWPVGLFVAGTAGAFADQEGLALCLEEQAGVLDAERRRTLALRVLAAGWAEDGAGFVETVRRLTGTHGLSAPAAVSIAERSARGSGVARDVGYLAGYLRVAALREASPAGFAELRRARVSIEACTLLTLDGMAPGGPLLSPPIATLEAAHAHAAR